MFAIRIIKKYFLGKGFNSLEFYASCFLTGVTNKWNPVVSGQPKSTYEALLLNFSDIKQFTLSAILWDFINSQIWCRRMLDNETGKPSSAVFL